MNPEQLRKLAVGKALKDFPLEKDKRNWLTTATAGNLNHLARASFLEGAQFVIDSYQQQQILNDDLLRIHNA